MKECIVCARPLCVEHDHRLCVECAMDEVDVWALEHPELGADA
jgi:hypothetical protein